MAAEATVNIQTGNLEECLVVESAGEPRTVGNLRLVEAKIVEKQSPGYCGCKSSLIHYRVDGYRSDYVMPEIAAGYYSAGRAPERSFEFVVAPDSTDDYEGFEIQLSCMPPA